MKKIITLFLLLASISFYGQWWVPQNSGVTANLNDVYGITGDVVLVVGNGGTILKTTDGGDHWVFKSSGTLSNLFKVQFVNATIGFAVGADGILLKTTDAGEHWVIVPTGITTVLNGLSCLSENIFYISGDDGLIKKTTDGGTTFTDYSYTGSYSFSTLQFINEQVGYASSYGSFGSGDPVLIKTTNGGATWTLLSDNITSFYFLNETTGYAKGLGGSILKTTDGGLTLDIAGESYSPTVDFYVSNENVVWSVENNFTLCNCSFFCIKKRDFTVPEQPVQTENCYADTGGNPPFEAITFANATTGYVVGDFGIIYKNTTGNMEDLGLESVIKSDPISLTPNPASSTITIANSTLSQLETVAVLDMHGRTVLLGGRGTSTLDVSALTKGIYLVQLHYLGATFTKKLIKE